MISFRGGDSGSGNGCSDFGGSLLWLGLPLPLLLLGEMRLEYTVCRLSFLLLQLHYLVLPANLPRENNTTKYKFAGNDFRRSTAANDDPAGLVSAKKSWHAVPTNMPQNSISEGTIDASVDQ